MSMDLAAILSANAAAERLPFGKRAALAWMIAEGLVKEIAGRRVVVWDDVVQRVRESGTGAPAPARARRRGRAAGQKLRRFSLD